MTNTKTILFAALLALATAASAHPADRGGDRATAHLSPPDSALAVYQTLEMQPGTTIDFSDVTQAAPGPLRGYVYVRFQGELVVIPVYHPTPDGTVWRATPPVTK